MGDDVCGETVGAEEAFFAVIALDGGHGPVVLFDVAFPE